jgi:YidC/Oxa1 family membrane protein insertase
VIDSIATLLESVLVVLRGVAGSYTLAIILLTFVIKAVLHPLTRKQLNSMKAMQALAPQMEVLRRKYKDDPRQLNVEIMNLYRAHKVNPLGGCLPMLLQLPVLWALFTLLRRQGIFGGEQLFGVSLELAPSFALMMQHPMLVLIPLLTAATTYYQQHLSITDPQQARMFIFMPILLAYFSVQFPIALSVYWISSTVAYIVEYLLVVGFPKRPGVAPPKGQRAVRAATKAKSSTPRPKEDR